MKSRLTCLDAPGIVPATDQCPRPHVRRHGPDVENLWEQVSARTYRLLTEESPRYLYVNPIVTITCDEPTSEFFSLIRKRQAEWCSRSRTLFSRRLGRRVKNWFTGTERTKFERFMSRGLLFTGLLFVNGQTIPQHQWPSATQ